MTLSILALLGLILATAGAELSSRIVRTKYGELSGVIVTLDRYLEGVEVFRGVPYASPPIGSLRFMPPVTGALWQGVKIADKFGPVCPQKLPELSDKMPKGRLEYLKRLLPYLKNQSEDCLYLNIYAPVQGCKLLVSRSHLQESHYGPFAYNSAIDSSIKGLRWMIGPWRIFPIVRERRLVTECD
ncbi:NLGNY protein, partial [Acromyrmex insinuator]